MKLRITHTVDRSQLEWATYHFTTKAMPLSKERILRYLRNQLEMFGSDHTSLMGSNWEEPDEYEDKDWARAVAFVGVWEDCD